MSWLLSFGLQNRLRTQNWYLVDTNSTYNTGTPVHAGSTWALKLKSRKRKDSA